ncbi:ADP-ribose diphosphatase [Malassezia cuniculi]|uniref:ADP-ribose diphosphatase n=1 Tax=Malassezia cuniculi TaxID=948313 RepID=A0AAF0EVB1_9BASI|nr:ADP-ribose diphosphatase [Malassezia cuniculi]
MSTLDPHKSKIVRSRPLGDESRWIGLRAIEWIDPSGRHRVWESADRKTRKGEVDAVAVLALIRRPSKPVHVLLVSQFRPPVGRCAIELPAGLVDAGEEGDEGARRAAIRELREETGYTASAEVQVSTEMVSDPGLTGANMKLCTVEISLADDAPEPVAEPDEGEYIERHLVPLATLSESLAAFSRAGYAVDARLAHFAHGLALANRMTIIQ